MAKSVKIILLHDVPHLGQKNEVKSVTFGFVKNWLIPQKLAALATPVMVAQIERAKVMKEEALKREAGKYETMLKELERFTLRLRPKKTAKDTLYGAINAKTLAQKLKEKGISVEEKYIQIDEPIKKVGEYEVSVVFSTDFKAKIKVIVQ